MNNYKKRKLGISVTDTKPTDQLKNEIQIKSPISLAQTNKDFLNYSNKNIKNVNLGSLNNPTEVVTVESDNNIKQIQLNNTNYFYYKSVKYFSTAGAVFTFTPKFNTIDPNNPYDPIFSRFDRMSSFSKQVYTSGSFTGVRIGDKQKFLNYFPKFEVKPFINIKGAGLNINGLFRQTSSIINGRHRYVNNLNPYPADIIWQEASPSGFIPKNTNSTTGSGFWLLRQSNVLGDIDSVSLTSFQPRYLSSLIVTGYNTYLQDSVPTGSWFITGNGVVSGKSPTPTSNLQNIEGFFKIATTRVSRDENKLFASGYNSTIVVGSTSGNKPSNYSWVSYPHNYYTTNYPALIHDTIIVPELIQPYNFNYTVTGINDIIVISTGISNKKIIYVSPHKVYSFTGFWSDSVVSKKLPYTGKNNQVLPKYDVVLNSGKLITVSSQDFGITGLESRIFLGTNAPNITLYNLDSAMLKQTVNLKDTPYYKLYEPIYRSGTFNTGTWNGVIPKGTPFQIEILRTKNSNYGVKNIKYNVYASGHFSKIKGTPLVSKGISFGYTVSDNFYNFGLVGNFYATDIGYSKNSQYEANYIAEKKANKKLRAKINSALWSKGLTKTNSKVKKMVKLHNNKKWPTDLYCYEINTPTGLSMICGSGVLTSAGIRTYDNKLIQSNFGVKIKPTWYPTGL